MASWSSISLFAALSVAVIAVVMKWRFRPHPVPGVPHHPITSVWGDMTELGKSISEHGGAFEPGGFFEESYRKLGPVFQFLLGPFASVVVIVDVQETEDTILRSASKSLEPRLVCNNVSPYAINADLSYSSKAQIYSFSAVLPHGQVALHTNELWQRHRRLTNPFMSSTQLSRLGPAIGEATSLFVRLWQGKIDVMKKKGGVCFSCKGDFEISTLDVMTKVIAGRQLGFTQNALDQVHDAVPGINKYSGAVFVFKDLPMWNAIRRLFGALETSTHLPPYYAWAYGWVLKLHRPYQRQAKIVRGFIQDCLKDSRTSMLEGLSIGEEPRPPKSMTDFYVQTERKDKGLLPKEDLSDELLTFLLTANSLKWAVKLLTDAPDVQRKLHSELMALPDSPEKRDLTYADVTNPEVTPYLEAVVAEILRCGRLAEAPRRQTTKLITILGHHLPAGTEIMFATPLAAMEMTAENEAKFRARDSVRSGSSLKHGLGGRRFLEDPRRFNPDRWLDSQLKFDSKAGFHAPWGLGVRACAGKNLALLELKFYVAALNLAFFLDKIPSELGTYRPMTFVTRQPMRSFVNPQPWPDHEADSI